MLENFSTKEEAESKEKDNVLDHKAPANAEANDGSKIEFLLLFEEIEPNDTRHTIEALIDEHDLIIRHTYEAVSFDDISEAVVVDPDVIMRRLEAPSYSLMLEKLKERYNKNTGFKEIVEWLNEENIPYHSASSNRV